MEYIVSILPSDGSTRIMIPLDIPTPLLSKGVVEGYAMKLCGWTPTIPNPAHSLPETIKVQSEPDADGVITESEIPNPDYSAIATIPNPMSAIDACALRIRSFVREDYRGVVASMGSEAGRLQALSQFDSVFQ